MTLSTMTLSIIIIKCNTQKNNTLHNNEHHLAKCRLCPVSVFKLFCFVPLCRASLGCVSRSPLRGCHDNPHNDTKRNGTLNINDTQHYGTRYCVMLCIVWQKLTLQSVVRRSVVRPSVIMLNVVAPFCGHTHKEKLPENHSKRHQEDKIISKYFMVI
jgi:hypothetical protein